MRSAEVSSGQLSSAEVKLRSAEDRPGQLRSVQARSGQLRSAQVSSAPSLFLSPSSPFTYYLCKKPSETETRTSQKLKPDPAETETQPGETETRFPRNGIQFHPVGGRGEGGRRKIKMIQFYSITGTEKYSITVLFTIYYSIHQKSETLF